MTMDGRLPTGRSPSLTYNEGPINLPAFLPCLISRLNEGEMVTTIIDAMFAPYVNKDPLQYYGRIRDEVPVH